MIFTGSFIIRITSYNVCYTKLLRNKIDAVVGGQQDICENHTFLEANNPSPGVGTWSVVGGASQARFTNSNDPTTEVLDLAKGNNQLRWTINNKGCITTAEVSVVT